MESKMGRKKKAESSTLTETELKLMNIIWEIEPATVHQVIEKLGNDYAYNTVSTIIRVLEQKEFLFSIKEGRSHLYSAKINKQDYEKIGLGNMVNGLFNGTPLNLVKSLLGSGKLSKNDLEELEDLIREQK